MGAGSALSRWRARVATLAAQELAQRFEGDPNSAAWRHYGRLAGFTNQKPIHRTENGLSPYVLAHTGNGQLAPRGTELGF